jgi:HSP20 family molecular chaperone IbpA
VDTDKVTATFKAGVLELHAKKAEVAMPKKIPVTT